MKTHGIIFNSYPKLNRPVFIAGFDGWGNAQDVSKATTLYLVRKLNASCFANLNPDLFYSYDKARPQVRIEEGDLKRLTIHGGSFYAVQNPGKGNDLVILSAHEPHLNWYNFSSELLSLCEKMGVEKIITLGSMFDSVLHTDMIVSGIASSPELFEKLSGKGVLPISYNGPSAVHSIIHSEANSRGFQSASLWCHCPYYLQGITHFGLIAALGKLLSSVCEFDLDTEDLEQNWEKLKKKIQALIEKSDQLKEIIGELRKAKVRGSWAGMKGAGKADDKVIDLSDFLDPS
jgi:proteasome assembly chaperone (PAC2) family protein